MDKKRLRLSEKDVQDKIGSSRNERRTQSKKKLSEELRREKGSIKVLFNGKTSRDIMSEIRREEFKHRSNRSASQVH